MGLVLVRVDDRLVHGQVMVGWRRFLKATRIIVASNRLSANPVACSVLRLTGPPEVSLVIDTIQNITKRFHSGEFDEGNSILLFENLADILHAIDLGMDFDHLNLGGIRHQDSCIAFTPSVSLTESDIRHLMQILGKGINIDIQMLPKEKSIPLYKELLDRRLKR